MQLNQLEIRSPRATRSLIERLVSETFRPKFGWKVSDAGRFWLLTIGLLLTFAHSVSLADTTWVSGAVSGEWTRAGNPFIVEDDATVQIGDTLVIGPGVQIYFKENRGLNIRGELVTAGSLNDSVTIRVANRVQHWKGLRFYRPSAINLSYVSIECPDTALVVVTGNGFIFTIANSRIRAEGAAFAESGRVNVFSWQLRLVYSDIWSGRFYFSLDNGDLYVGHSSLYFGRPEDRDDQQYSIGVFQSNTVRMIASQITGGLHSEECRFVRIDSCRFYKPPETQKIFVGLYGPGSFITNSFVEGGTGIIFGNFDSTLFCNDTIFGDISISMESGGRIKNCVVYGNISAWNRSDPAADVNIKNTLVYGGLGVVGAPTLTVDSCVFDMQDVSTQGGNNNTIEVVCLSLMHNVFNNMYLMVRTRDGGIIDHNLFQAENNRFGFEIMTAGGLDTISNNIFIGRRSWTTDISLDHQVAFLYNCYDRIEDIARGGTPLDSIPATNFRKDPKVIREGIIWQLARNSPCIDAGNPDSPLDPDGTRSDIGPFYYRQAESVSTEQLQPSLLTYIPIEAFPTPFNNKLSVSFTIQEPGPISISIRDLTGRIVYRNVIESAQAEEVRVSIEASDWTSGVYLLEAVTGSKIGIKTLHCLK